MKSTDVSWRAKIGNLGSSSSSSCSPIYTIHQLLDTLYLFSGVIIAI